MAPVIAFTWTSVMFFVPNFAMSKDQISFPFSRSISSLEIFRFGTFASAVFSAYALVNFASFCNFASLSAKADVAVEIASAAAQNAEIDGLMFNVGLDTARAALFIISWLSRPCEMLVAKAYANSCEPTQS